MTEDTEKKAIAFINSIASRCKSCLRRGNENCRDCLSNWASEIMSDYSADASARKHAEPDYSLSARMMKILDTLKKSKNPVPADKIDISEVCTPQLKQWTLKRMCDKGIIIRRKLSSKSDGKGNTQYGYSIADTTRLPVL